MKDRTCERHKRCGRKECGGALCDNYKYNHNRFQKFQKTLPVPLTAEEVDEQVNAFVDAKDELDALQKRLKDQASIIKGSIAEQEGIIDKARALLKARSVDKCIECERHFDYIEKKVKEVRKDTGEVLKERDMTEDELQEEMASVVQQAEEQHGQKTAAENEPEDSGNDPDGTPDVCEDEDIDGGNDEATPNLPADVGESEEELAELNGISKEEQGMIDNLSEKCALCGAKLPKHTEEVLCSECAEQESLF